MVPVCQVGVLHDGHCKLGAISDRDIDNLVVICIDLVPISQISEYLLVRWIGIELTQPLKSMLNALLLRKLRTLLHFEHRLIIDRVIDPASALFKESLLEVFLCVLSFCKH